MIKRMTVYMVLVFSSCLSFGQVDNGTVLDQVTQEIGPIVKPEKAPALYKNLTEIFNRLAKAQEQIAEGSSVAISDMYIVQSNELNAFVNTEKNTGVRISRNHVFITTALIQKMTQNVALEVGMARIAGIFAHELGHPMDTISEYRGQISIGNHYGTQGDQAAEIRADIDGMIILRKAEMPTNSLYLALSALFYGSDSKHSASAVNVLIGSHPQVDFRLTSARLFLTMDRLQNGLIAHPYQFKLSDQTNFTKEMKSFITDSGRYPYKKPIHFEDAIRRIKQAEENASADYTFESSEFRKLETNRLILSADHFLAEIEKKGRELTNSEEKSFRDYMRFLLTTKLNAQEGDQSNKFEIYRAIDLREKINKGSGVSGLEASLAHESFLLKLKIFSSPLAVDELKKMNNENEKLKPLYEYFNVAHPKIVFKVFSDFFSLEQKTSEIARFSDFLNGRSLPFIAEYLVLARPHLAKFEKDPNFIKLKATTIRSLFPLPMAPYYMAEPYKDFVMQFRKARIYADSSKDHLLKQEMQSATQEVENYFSNIWQKRGFYAAMEMGFSLATDWDLIFEVLKIDPKIGRNQIQQAAKGYMDGNLTYADLPAYNESVQGLKFDQKSYGYLPKLAWNTKVLTSSLTDDFVIEKYFAKNSDAYYAQLYKNLSNVVEKEMTSDRNTNHFLKEFFETHNKLAGLPDIMASNQSEAIRFKKMMAWLDKTAMKSEYRSALLNVILFGETPKDFDPTLVKSFLNKFAANNAIAYTGEGPAIDIAIQTFLRYASPSAGEFFKRYKAAIMQHKLEDSDYFFALDQGALEIQKEISKKQFKTFDELISFASILQAGQKKKMIYEQSGEAEAEQFSQSDAGSEQKNSSRIQKTKNLLLEHSKNLNLSLGQKYKLFLTITRSGPTRQTDKLLTEILRLVDPADTKTSYSQLSINQKAHVKNLLKQGRVSSDILKLNLTKIILEDSVKRLEGKKPVSRNDLYQLIARDLNSFSPNGSMEKDAYLEKLAWRLKLKGSELFGFIEDQKSSNWQKANPLLIRVGSTLSQQISKMSHATRLDTIEYLLDPVKNETKLFNQIVADFEKTAYADLLSGYRGQLTQEAELKLRQKARRTADVLKLQAEEAIRDSSAMERIPLFEVVLTAGADSLVKQNDWQKTIARKYLGYTAESIEEIMLETFIEILPKHEAAVTMSYLLANSTQSQGSMANLFEVFDTVGIKFGQLAAIWEIFGKKVAEETKHLKSQAKSLSRHEIISIAEKRDPSLNVKIAEVERIIGSASVKTVSEVRLADGRQAVMMLQGNALSEKISMNLNIGKQFIEKLKQKNKIKNSLFMQNMIEALEAQLVDEIDMRIEAQRFVQADEIIGKLNNEMKSELEGWTFRVPKILKDMPLRHDMAFYELANGDSLDDLSPELQKQIGALLVKANLKTLFKYGFVEPDRHRGNWMIDQKSKSIWWLDFGQFTNFDKNKNPFKWDPRITLAEFMRAINNKNSASLLHYAKFMATEKSDTTKLNEDSIKTQLDHVFKNATATKQDMKDTLLDLMNVLINNGIKVHSRYMFGALKGLIVLYGEGYVPEKVFEQQMIREITELVVKKSPYLAAKKVENVFKNLVAPNTKPAISCQSLFATGY